jgi:3-hydroxyisobutyrate dehydrogenase-like beta-hydroxyacid dehydrogenase
MENIGFVGTGAMGSALLSRLKLANVKALAFDIAPSGLAAARAEGAEIAASAKAVAQTSTLIDVVVRTDQEVLDCMLGRDGVLEGAAPGSLVLLHSTIRPATTKKVAEAAADKRVNVIDACMTAVPSMVRQGGLTFLVGGQKAFFDRAKPHLMNMAKDAIYMGPLGSGNVTKLFKYGHRFRSAHRLRSVANRQSGRHRLQGGPRRDAENQVAKYLGALGNEIRPFRRELKFNTGTNLYDKDLPLAADVGKSLGAEIPVVEALAKLGIKLNGGKVSI